MPLHIISGLCVCFSAGRCVLSPDTLLSRSFPTCTPQAATWEMCALTAPSLWLMSFPPVAEAWTSSTTHRNEINGQPRHIHNHIPHHNHMVSTGWVNECINRGLNLSFISEAETSSQTVPAVFPQKYSPMLDDRDVNHFCLITPSCTYVHLSTILYV